MNHIRNRRSAGFTLIEMVVVVAVISILASIAIPNYQTVRAKAEAARIATQLHYMEDAIVEVLLEGATQADFNYIESADVATSVLGDFLTSANFDDVPDGFGFAISARDDGTASGEFFVYVTLNTSGAAGPKILEELEGMFPPHSFGEMGEYFWIGINSRTLSRTNDGN